MPSMGASVIASDDERSMDLRFIVLESNVSDER
jgi:hypothetical protein